MVRLVSNHKALAARYSAPDLHGAPDMKPTPNLAIDGPLLALLALLWGASYLFIKVAVTEIPPTP
jgi:hypothetical protein